MSAAYQSHSPTSMAAAVEIAAKAPTLRGQVLRSLRDDGPATDEQIQQRLGMGANTERPRRRELQKLGLVVDSGRTRPTLSGRQAVVWAVAEAVPAPPAPKPAPKPAPRQARPWEQSQRHPPTRRAGAPQQALWEKL